MVDFKALESAPEGTRIVLEEALEALKFDDRGLLPAIAQDVTTGEVLMLAWMNVEAVRSTLKDGYATYFSRSRQALWRKGETSGHTQKLQSMHFDCDGDAILMKVEQRGPACHTERANCFYLTADGTSLVVTSDSTD